MLMNPNNMIMILLLNMPFKNHLPVTVITIAIVYVFGCEFFSQQVTKDEYCFAELKIGQYCSTVSLKTVWFCIRHGQGEWRANF